MTSRLKVASDSRRRTPGFVDRAISFAVLTEDDQEVRRTKRLITGALWLALLAPWPQVAQLIAADAPWAAVVIGGSFLSAAIVLLIMWWRPHSFPAIFHVVVATNLAIAVAMTLLFGGFLASGINFAWAVVLIFGALIVFRDWRALVWLAVSMVSLVAASLAAQYLEPLYEYPSPEAGAVVTFLLVLSFISLVFWYYVNQRAELLQVSDDLLRNILPATIAERLKASDAMIADEYDQASILFADVVEFTPLSSGLSPNELVALLNEIFSEFDAMVESRGLEKIKTIGDAYMVASGVPEARSDHAHAICDLALEMHQAVTNRQYGQKNIDLRIGINSGPVVAGIIGTKKFSYDLWGDAVNVASRMESSGKPGRIQITEATRDLVHAHFDAEPGGVVDIKGKGPTKIWFLEGRLATP